MIVHITINARWFVNQKAQCKDGEKHGRNWRLNQKKRIEILNHKKKVLSKTSTKILPFVTTRFCGSLKVSTGLGGEEH